MTNSPVVPLKHFLKPRKIHFKQMKLIKNHQSFVNVADHGQTMASNKTQRETETEPPWSCRLSTGMNFYLLTATGEETFFCRNRKEIKIVPKIVSVNWKKT